MRTKLPSRPSSLIRLALHDLRACEADPGYRIHMGTYHSWGFGACTVCLAGAVMAQTLKVEPLKFAVPSDFTASVFARLEALNYFRAGCMELAFECLDLPRTTGKLFEWRHITSYVRDPAQFHTDMEQLAQDLEDANL